MDFAGPLSIREHKDDYYILVTVDRLTRYLHAKVFKNCDTETALKYIEEYCNFHGIPRSIRCDQAQALKAREFGLYCKDKNIKLILAPAGDHRNDRAPNPNNKTPNRNHAIRPALVQRRPGANRNKNNPIH